MFAAIYSVNTDLSCCSDRQGLAIAQWPKVLQAAAFSNTACLPEHMFSFFLMGACALSGLQTVDGLPVLITASFPCHRDACSCWGLAANLLMQSGSRINCDPVLKLLSLPFM